MDVIAIILFGLAVVFEFLGFRGIAKSYYEHEYDLLAVAFLGISVFLVLACMVYVTRSSPPPTTPTTPGAWPPPVFGS
jgi:hypothetical protein